MYSGSPSLSLKSLPTFCSAHLPLVLIDNIQRAQYYHTVHFGLYLPIALPPTCLGGRSSVMLSLAILVTMQRADTLPFPFKDIRFTNVNFPKLKYRDLHTSRFEH